MNTIYLIIAIILLIPGIIGILIPILPGIPYMFVISLIYGFITKFQNLHTSEIIILALIALLSLLVDYSTGIIGAKYGGATKQSLLIGLLGLIIGTIVLPPFGGIIGLFIGVLIAEILAHQNRRRAVKAATGSLIGSLAGIIINLILSLVFITLFILFSLK